MVNDFIETFAEFEHLGIRTVRATMVDSAEAAIAFAQRRTARDTRMVPIVLRTPEGLTDVLTTDSEIAAAYDRVRKSRTPWIAAQDAVAPGEEVCVIGATDNHGRKFMRVMDQTEPVPLTLDAAAALALSVREYKHREPLKTRRMLEHLFLSFSAFFQHPALTGFSATVHLHENGYTVIDGVTTSTHVLKLPRESGKHARDRKGHYRPSGRQ